MNVCSFFFSYIPLDDGEYEMWRIFRRWGRIIDVFIAKRLNQKGQCFGFVK